MVHRLLVVSPEGDTVVATWEPGGAAAENEARAEFERLMQANFMPVAEPGTAQARLLKKFDPEAREILMVLPMSGG